MLTNLARKYFQEFSASVAFVEILDKNGDSQIGSAYHIGEGVFVTARHVVDVAKIKQVGFNPRFVNEIVGDKFEIFPIKPDLNIIQGPFFHPDPTIDVACFKCDNDQLPAIPLGSHLDDWIGDELILTSTLVMGYPPIPFAKDPLLVATIAEINAIVDKYTGGHPHFVLSAMARGGFSGGVAISEYGFAMGVVTESLTENHNPTELGYFSVISVEPIYVCLAHHKIMPNCVKEMWIDLDGSSIWDNINPY